jgi:hypothetical protein
VLTLVSSQAGLNDPGAIAQPFQYIVNWGDDNGGNNDAIQTFTLMLKSPVGNPLLSAQTTMLQSVRTVGGEGVSTTGSFDVVHQYLGPPNPLNPSADITISVTVFDDNLGSDVASIAIGNPGIQVVNVRIDTTPDVPRLEFVPQPITQVLFNQTSTSPQSLQTSTIRVSVGELALTSDRYLELVVISPEGKETLRYRLKDEALVDLRGLIATLPDNHYKIYLVSTETESRRLVLDVYVRQGHVVDPSDESEGTRDRPPTEGGEQNQEQPLENNPFLEEDAPAPNPAEATTDTAVPAEPASVEIERAERAGAVANEAAVEVLSASRLRWAIPLAGWGLLARRGSWSSEVDAAFERADDQAWQRLRRAGRLRSVK